MSTTTGATTISEEGIKHGLTPIPPDDPIYKNGWTIGATMPYRQAPNGSQNEASATAPAGGMSDPEVAAKIQGRVDQSIDELNRRDGLI